MKTVKRPRVITARSIKFLPVKLPSNGWNCNKGNRGAGVGTRDFIRERGELRKYRFVIMKRVIGYRILWSGCICVQYIHRHRKTYCRISGHRSHESAFGIGFTSITWHLLTFIAIFSTQETPTRPRVDTMALIVLICRVDYMSCPCLNFTSRNYAIYPSSGTFDFIEIFLALCKSSVFKALS